MKTDLHSTAEDGFTLAELLVYCMLMVVVVAIASGILITVMKNTTTVTAMNETTSAGQLAVDSIDSSIRNSSDFRLTNPSGNDDQLLVTRMASTVAGPITWSCMAWYYSAAGAGSIRSMRSTTTIVPPSAAGLATWTLLADGVRPLSGTSIFTATAKQVTVKFKSSAANQTPIGITSAAVSRAGASGSPACY